MGKGRFLQGNGFKFRKCLEPGRGTEADVWAAGARWSAGNIVVLS